MGMIKIVVRGVILIYLNFSEYCIIYTYDRNMYIREYSQNGKPVVFYPCKLIPVQIYSKTTEI